MMYSTWRTISCWKKSCKWQLLFVERNAVHCVMQEWWMLMWVLQRGIMLACARNYRPCFRENQPKRSFSIKWKRAFWACFRENCGSINSGTAVIIPRREEGSAHRSVLGREKCFTCVFWREMLVQYSIRRIEDKIAVLCFHRRRIIIRSLILE